MLCSIMLATSQEIFVVYVAAIFALILTAWKKLAVKFSFSDEL